MYKWNSEDYFKNLKKMVDVEYSIASEARAKGLDPAFEVESPLAMTMAERSVTLVRIVYPNLPINKIADRILKLEEKYGQLDTTVVFEIAREIAEEKFCKFEDKISAVDAGIRVGFSYMTLGVVASPIEGYTGLSLGKTDDGRDYFIASFSGPIRSAGTTSVCMVLMLIDYMRESFGFAKYDATEKEVERYVVENRDFHQKVANLQYFPTEEEIRFLASRLPIQIDGDPTNRIEVSNYKDLKRVGTNFIRGGMCLAFSEGLAQKAGKALGRLKSCKKNGLKCSGFDWLEEYLVVHKKRESGVKDVAATYIKDLVAGRPVYGHPSRSGGFRFRYGRGRTAGFSAVSIHPATMGISNGFLSHGTQLKIEKPTKGCIITSCDSIDGPIVKLKDGSVKRLNDFDEAKNLYKEVDEIIYLGDILFPLGDVIDRNSDLIKPGYVEEWWELESGEKRDVSFDEAIEISRKKGVALCPKYIFYWSQIFVEDFYELLNWLDGSIWNGRGLILSWKAEEREKFSKSKRALEILGVEHAVCCLDNQVVVGRDSRAFLFNLGKIVSFDEEILKFDLKKDKNKDVLATVNELCEIEIKDKAGSFIGARMGRPEKAKLRKLTGSPNVLFPLDGKGGRLNSIQEAVRCGFFRNNFEYSVKKLGYKDYEINPLVKGVKEMENKGEIVEDLGKGILRAKFGLSVNKDGTVRYDAVEIPLTHFKPKEIRTSIEKLRKLGYLKDICGEDLISDDQILELRPHDVVLPSCSESQDEKAGDVFFNIANFVDEELERFYGLKKYYNLKDKQDLIGQLIVCMAPHNCAGVVGRIIGFSEMQGLLASPYMHAAMRRDCDGDEAAVMMLMDVLLNFSRRFLPSHRGGSQDAPLVLNTRIRAGEVDDQILFFETCFSYPLELYKMAENGRHSSEVGVELVRNRLKNGDFEPFVGAGFTHDTSDFNLGNINGAYKSLPSMKEKVAAQMELVGKIRAVDEDDVARLILERHFIRDIRGNLRKFGKQSFRCVSCGESFRRPPLKGSCWKCDGKLIFTISEGSVRKYFELAMELAKDYNISSYTKETIELIGEYIERVFGKEER